MTLTATRPPEVSAQPPQAGTVVADWVRSNRLFCTVIGVGVVVRLLVAIAYAPALEFFGDSPAYLASAAHPDRISLWHPSGYPVFLWVLSATHSLLVVTLLQHALGIASGVLVYQLMRRFNVGTVGSTIAASPLLLDAYQINLEQFVLSDTLFTFLTILTIVLALRVIRRPTALAAFALGLVIAATTLTRTVGLAVALAVLITMAVARVPLRRIGAAGLTCAVPLLGYALAFHATYGVYALQGYSGRYLYGMVAPVADCRPSTLYCPTTPKAGRPGSNQYVWEVYDFVQPRQKLVRSSEEAGAFARHIAVHQPFAVGGAVLGDFAHYFSPTRSVGPRDWFVGSWQFPTADPAPGWNISPAGDGFGGTHLHSHINSSLATVLRGYQQVVFVPGLAMAFAAVLAAASLFMRRRRSPRHPVVLLASCGLLLLLMPSASAGFDWRYALPAQALLIPAGVLGVHRLLPLLRGRRPRLVPWILGVAAAAVVLPSVVVPSVYAADSLRPATIATTPGTVLVGHRLDVTVGPPALLNVSCRWKGSTRRLGALVKFPVTFQHVAGRPMLVQASNFAIGGGYVMGALSGERRHPDIAPALVGAAYPTVTGTLGAFVTTTNGVLRYVDPLGAGAAAWSYAVTPPPGTHLGTPCSGSSPWANAQLPGLHVNGMPLFTNADTETVAFGLRHQPGRARSFDLRMRVIAADGQAGPWQLLAGWQHARKRPVTLSRLVPGSTYCLSVRARDALDVATAWSTPTCTTRLFDDAALPPAAPWVVKSGYTGFYDDTATIASAHGASMSVGEPFHRAALLVYRCPRCGVLDVYAGTIRLGQLNLSVPSAMAGLHLWVSGRTTAKTLTLRVASTGRPVVIDGFGFSLSQDASASAISTGAGRAKK
jgi:hypothetical protein